MLKVDLTNGISTLCYKIGSDYFYGDGHFFVKAPFEKEEVVNEELFTDYNKEADILRESGIHFNIRFDVKYSEYYVEVYDVLCGKDFDYRVKVVKEGDVIKPFYSYPEALKSAVEIGYYFLNTRK